MATESDLRDLLQHPDPEGRGAIDVDAVLRRARRRRRPRLIAAQALGSVAVVGVLGTAIFVAQPPAQEAAMIAQDTDAGAEQAAPFADESSLKAGDICGQPLIVEDSPVWLLELTGVEVAPDTITAEVHILATRPDPSAEGSGELLALTVIRDGVVVADASPTDITTSVGQGSDGGLIWTGSFALGSCDGEPLAPGSYEIRAVAQVTTGDAVDTVYGSLRPLEIR